MVQTVGYNKDTGFYAACNGKSSTGNNQHGPRATTYKKQYLHTYAYILFIHIDIRQGRKETSENKN